MEATMPEARTVSTRRERWGWYLYDFGNSAYAAVVLLAFYSTYFKDAVVGGAEGSRLWGIAVGIAMLVVAVISPVLGTIADFSGAKKRFLLFFTVQSCLFTALLFLVRQGDVVIGMLFFILAEIGYRSAQVFYNSLLPEIAAPEEMGRVSGNGWAIGSLGGILCLLLVLPLVVLIGGQLIVRFSFVITAVFFALSAVPVFLWLRERAQPQSLPEGESYLTVAFKRLLGTARTVRSYREFIKFVVAFLIYNDGILMALDFAAIFGMVIFGLNQQELLIFMIIVQVTSVPGAYLGGLMADRIGAKRTLIVSILLMVASVVGLFFNQSRLAFFVLGALAGFALTAVQSVSRTVVGTFTPPGKSAEFYGFFAVVGRTSSFIGPTIYGWLAAETYLWFKARGADAALLWFKAYPQGAELAEQLGQRLAVLSIVVFLIVGLVFLLFVNEKKARAAAQAQGGDASA
jgi:UMF1 family MFS transporter